MDKNDKKHNDKSNKKKKADKNNPKIKVPYIAGNPTSETPNTGVKPKKSY